MMLRDKNVRIGLVGTVIVALCCFTPVLTLLLIGVGIGWAVGYLDYVLLPTLFFFVGLTVYASWKRSRGLQLVDAEIDCDCSPAVHSSISEKENEI